MVTVMAMTRYIVMFRHQVIMTIAMSDELTLVNPLSPHDALKHYFTSLKTYLIFLKLRVLEGKFL